MAFLLLVTAPEQIGPFTLTEHRPAAASTPRALPMECIEAGWRVPIRKLSASSDSPLEHHALVLLTLCTGGPTQALRGKIAVFLGGNDCRTHNPIPYAIMSGTEFLRILYVATVARAPQSAIDLKVDAEIPEICLGKPQGIP